MNKTPPQSTTASPFPSATTLGHRGRPLDPRIQGQSSCTLSSTHPCSQLNKGKHCIDILRLKGKISEYHHRQDRRPGKIDRAPPPPSDNLFLRSAIPTLPAISGQHLDFIDHNCSGESAYTAIIPNNEKTQPSHHITLIVTGWLML